jgi:cytoskeletal protein RodZ
MVDMTKKGVSLAVGILVFGLMVAYLLPVAITPMNQDSVDTYNQTVNNSVSVTGPLESNVTNVDDTGNTVSLTLENTDTGDSASVSSLSEGSSQEVTVSGGSINVTHDSVTSANSSQITYEYPTDYGWGNGSSALFNLLPIFFVVGVFLFAVRKLT